MGHTRSDFERAIRLYQGDNDEQALDLVDEILGIAGSNIHDTLSVLKARPQAGDVPLIEVLEFRSKCLSAIMFGKNKQPKERYFPLAVRNAVLVINLLPEVENETIARIWIIAAQSPTLSGDPTHVEMALFMLHTILKYHVNLRTDGAVLAVTKSVLPMRMAAGQLNSKTMDYWHDIEMFLASSDGPGIAANAGGNRKGFWARLFG